MPGGDDPQIGQQSGGGAEGTRPLPTRNRAEPVGTSSQEETLEWIRKFYSGMAERQHRGEGREQSLSPIGQQPPADGSLEATWNLASHTYNESNKHALRLGGLAESMRTMRAKYQDPAFLVERYLMGLLNESFEITNRLALQGGEGLQHIERRCGGKPFGHDQGGESG